MGKFIVIEGLEGAGKSTAISVVKNWLLSQHVKEADIILTREPGGTRIAEKLRDIVKTAATDEKIAPQTELLLMIASRVQLVKTVIQPALSRGAWVISDRYELSTRAYQGGGRGIPLTTLQTLHTLCLDNFQPDLTLFLDISPEVGFQRIQSRGHKDRIEQEDLAFFQRVRDVYHQCLHESSMSQSIAPIVEINALNPMDKVHTDIQQQLGYYWKLWNN